MAYVVRKGTRIVVRKPSGQVVQHACRDECRFFSHELKKIEFHRDGFVITVSAADLVETSFHCPQCARTVETEGLCDRCRERWLPK